MDIVVLLTSYNRFRLLPRALSSLQAQTWSQWRCLILDSGSDVETRRILDGIADPRFEIRVIPATPKGHRTRVQRAVKLNVALRMLQENIVHRDSLVCYLADNAEYNPNFLAAVLRHFTQHPGHFAAYAPLHRDVWNAEEREIVDRAALYGYDDTLPPPPPQVRYDDRASVVGVLGSSQVAHRLPARATWPEDACHRRVCDGRFYDRLIQTHGAIHAVATDGAPLVTEHVDFYLGL